MSYPMRLFLVAHLLVTLPCLDFGLKTLGLLLTCSVAWEQIGWIFFFCSVFFLLTFSVWMMLLIHPSRQTERPIPLTYDRSNYHIAPVGLQPSPHLGNRDGFTCNMSRQIKHFQKATLTGDMFEGIDAE